MNALSFLASGPWTTTGPNGEAWTFTFTSNGTWFWTGAGATAGKGKWIQPMLQLFVDVTPVLTGPATSLSHCQFSWVTSQKGTLLMTRQ